MESKADNNTKVLLERMHGGDREALGALLEKYRPWLERQVRSGLNTKLRASGDTRDYVGDLIVRVLEHGPRFVVTEERHFRAILLQIARNLIIDSARRMGRMKRDYKREVRMPTRQTVLYLGMKDGPAQNGSSAPTSPGLRAQHAEERDYLQFAMELIPADERNLIELHEIEGKSFDELGAIVGLSAEGARKRFIRAVGRLGTVVVMLRFDNLDEALKWAGAVPR